MTNGVVDIRRTAGSDTVILHLKTIGGREVGRIEFTHSLIVDVLLPLHGASVPCVFVDSGRIQESNQEEK